MNEMMRRLVVGVFVGMAVLSAQVETPPGTKGAVPPSRVSDVAREAFSEARQLVRAARGLTGPERSHRIEAAASAFDGLVARFADEAPAAAQAAFEAAELWRRHGSLALAEKDYLYAGRKDVTRYGQRALLGAADMQRRQQRTEEASLTYRKAIEADPATSRAQHARLWLARMQQAEGRLDDAIASLQAALERAPTPRLAIDTSDLLAKVWIEKGDLEAAGFAIDHAEALVEKHVAGDPIAAERLRRACASMSARRALQRALDREHDAAGDAVELDEHRRRDPDRAKARK